MPNQDAQTFAQALVEMWVTRFGSPVNLHCEKKRNFISQPLRDFYRIPDIESTSTTCFHSEENAMIKRTNKT